MVRRILTIWLLSALLAQAALADPITYRQLRQDAGAAFTRIPTPPTASDVSNKRQQGGQQAGQDNQAPRAQESPNHPEFVRLPDGRIVKYGPGVICDENCVEEGIPLGRARVSRNWYVLPPLLAAGILCAVLCRGGGEPGAAPPIVVQPSPSPTVPPPPPTPPAEIPEPGTLVLLGLGLGAMLARRKLGKQTIE